MPDQETALLLRGTSGSEAPASVAGAWSRNEIPPCPEPRAGQLLRDLARQARAEQLCEQFVGGVDAVGVFERVEIHQ